MPARSPERAWPPPDIIRCQNSIFQSWSREHTSTGRVGCLSARSAAANTSGWLRDLIPGTMLRRWQTLLPQSQITSRADRICQELLLAPSLAAAPIQFWSLNVATTTKPLQAFAHNLLYSYTFCRPQPTMPIRNPFAKRTDVYNGFAQGEENVRPLDQNGVRPTFEKVDTMGSKSSAMSIRSGHSQDPPEYKLSGMRSVIN
jgi:hypothetical protein